MSDHEDHVYTNDDLEMAQNVDPKNTNPFSQPKTAWLWFYIKIRFPLSFIFGGLSIISNYLLLQNANYYYYETKDTLAYLLILGVGLLIFQILVYRNIKQFTPKGYYLNLVNIVVETLIMVLNNVLQSQDILSSFIIGKVVGHLIWCLLNMIYFKKRRHLFGLTGSTPKTKPERTQQEKVPKQHNCFLHKSLVKTIRKSYENKFPLFVEKIRTSYGKGSEEGIIETAEQTYYASVFEDVCLTLSKKQKKFRANYPIKSLVMSKCGTPIDMDCLSPENIFAFAYWVMTDTEAAPGDLAEIKNFVYQKENDVFKTLDIPTKEIVVVAQKAKRRYSKRVIAFSIVGIAIVLIVSVVLGIFLNRNHYYDTWVYVGNSTYHYSANCPSRSGLTSSTSIEKAMDQGFSLCHECHAKRNTSVYVSNIDDRYHSAQCSVPNKQHRSYRSISLIEAMQKGFKQCSACDPILYWRSSFGTTGSTSTNDEDDLSFSEYLNNTLAERSISEIAKKYLYKDLTVYVTNTGEKYHALGCDSLDNSCIAMNLPEAVDLGYSACSKCDPTKNS